MFVQWTENRMHDLLTLFIRFIWSQKNISKIIFQTLKKMESKEQPLSEAESLFWFTKWFTRQETIWRQWFLLFTLGMVGVHLLCLTISSLK